MLFHSETNILFKNIETCQIGPSSQTIALIVIHINIKIYFNFFFNYKILLIVIFTFI